MTLVGFDDAAVLVEVFGETAVLVRFGGDAGAAGLAVIVALEELDLIVTFELVFVALDVVVASASDVDPAEFVVPGVSVAVESVEAAVIAVVETVVEHAIVAGFAALEEPVGVDIEAAARSADAAAVEFLDHFATAAVADVEQSI